MTDRLPVRKYPRIRGFDYSTPGMYFVTICTDGRVCLFGEVVDGEMRLSRFGEIAAAAWQDLSNHHPGIVPDTFVVMPNHVHGIIDLTDRSVGATPASPAGRAQTKAAGALGNVVGAFKSSVSRQVNALRQTPAAPVWQRGFHDRVLRDEKDVRHAREYIAENPLKWHLDRENPLIWRR